MTSEINLLKTSCWVANITLLIILALSHLGMQKCQSVPFPYCTPLPRKDGQEPEYRLSRLRQKFAIFKKIRSGAAGVIFFLLNRIRTRIRHSCNFSVL